MGVRYGHDHTGATYTIKVFVNNYIFALYLKQISSKGASEDEVESIQCGVEEGGECVQTLADDRLAREWISHLLSRQCGAYQLTLSGTLHRARQGCF